VTLWLAWARRRVALRTPRWTLPMLVLLGVLFTVLRNLPPMTVLRP
jgi:hypothetical protein